MNGPATRRPTASTLCKLTGARSVIVQHRLAPQYPFPSQLLDVLHAYFTLLYPPPGSFHAPVDPKKLVLVADSSGSQLALGIIQVILAAQESQSGDPTLKFHGRSVNVVLPAGVALQSPSVGGCLPSWEKNAATDILPVSDLLPLAADMTVSPANYLGRSMCRITSQTFPRMPLGRQTRHGRIPIHTCRHI